MNPQADQADNAPKRPRIGFRALAIGILVTTAIAAMILSRRAPPDTKSPSRSPAEPTSPPLSASRSVPQAPVPIQSASSPPSALSGYFRPVPRPVSGATAFHPSTETQPRTESMSEKNKSPGHETKSTLPEIFRMPRPAPSLAPSSSPRRSAAMDPAIPDPGRAPFGRLIKCVLVNTLESLTSRPEPIIAVVTEDLSWNGKVIIPATTEALGYALPGAILDGSGKGRLLDSGRWILVLPGTGKDNGRELQLNARALDRSETRLTDVGDAATWALSDGAAGLSGTTVSTVGSEEAKLFATAATSGVIQGLSEFAQKQEPATGLAGLAGATQAIPSAANVASRALGEGGVALLGQVAQRIQQDLSRRGTYVRVPASKPFYLFVEEAIDLAKSTVGPRASSPSTKPPIAPLP